MDRKEILEKIAAISASLENDRGAILQAKIQQQEWHLQKSGRCAPLAKLINFFRRKLIRELAYILGPILENQREINLRLVKEIEKVKEACHELSKVDPTAGQKKHPNPAEPGPS